MPKYWIIRVITEPVWNRGSWEYNGIPLPSNRIEFGNSPIKDKKARLDFIKQLVEAGVDFTVTNHT